jgi:hypothetical protein
MADEPEGEEDVIETEEATAGGPQKHDPTVTRNRAETPGMLTPEELDKRQERIRTERRKGGPDLTKRAAEAAADEEEAPDTPATETEEPPST